MLNQEQGGENGRRQVEEYRNIHNKETETKGKHEQWGKHERW
jgi:hypothetical protein